MVASDLETVFIGHPVGSDHSAIRGRVGIRTARDGADIFWLRSDLLLNALLFNSNAIFSLETVNLSF